jgi:hypothetical protein
MEITELFNSDELHALSVLGIDPAALVYNDISRLPFVKDKQYVCHLRLTDGIYSFELPEKVPRKFKRQIIETEKKLLRINNAHVRKLMLGAKKNAEFVERFNSELFFKHSFYQGKRIDTAQLFDFYETHPYYSIVNLSADADKSPFMALYAITFFACTPDDLFTIDGIFSMQPERHADNAKKTAGNAVFNLILRNDRKEIEMALTQMGHALKRIHPLRVNLAAPVSLAKNYSLFVGLSEIGRVYEQICVEVFGENNADAAALTRYSPLAALCNVITVLADDDDYRETAAYKKCAEFA